MPRIAVDCMGGDDGLAVTIPAVQQLAKRHSDVSFLLVGLPDQIEAALKKHPIDAQRYTVVEAPEVITMEDSVEVALRKKRKSSMRIAIEQVKAGAADAVVSAGNTGALMAVSRYLLKTMDGIERPAIATAVPNMKGQETTILDLGANVECPPETLLQFGIMGSAMSQALYGHDNPSVGILNVGAEAMKGNDTVKRAAELLGQSDLNFFGNVEGDDIFKGTTDVVVTDGFTGNAVLKAIEGVVKLFMGTIKNEFMRSTYNKVAGLIAKPVFAGVKGKLDNRNYNGALMLGLNGVVVKSHGGTDAFGYTCALQYAYNAVHNTLLEKIQHSVNAIQALSQADEQADQPV